jgi:hypothetical protein
MRSAELAFHDHRVVGVMDGQLFEPEIGESRQQLAEQALYGFPAVYNPSHSRNLIPWMTECRQCGGNIVFHCFRFNVSVHHRFAAFTRSLGACSRHFKGPRFVA